MFIRAIPYLAFIVSSVSGCLCREGRADVVCLAVGLDGHCIRLVSRVLVSRIGLTVCRVGVGLLGLCVGLHHSYGYKQERACWHSRALAETGVG